MPITPTKPTLKPPKPDSNIMVGKTIDDGRILLLEQLGAGGFGQVYKAIGTTLTRDPTFYAVKVQPRHPEGSSRANRQAREVAIHRLLSDCPNVVTLHKVVSDDEFVYMVMDFCPDGDLLSLLKREELDDELVKKVFLQVIDALGQMHAKGVYHRDLKPQNILIGPNQEILIADFGLSTRSQSGLCVGTRTHQSPECFTSKETGVTFNNCANDIWSLGVILINMITKKSPWNAPDEDMDERFCEFVDCPVTLARQFKLSADAYRLIRRMLDLDPETRTGLQALKLEMEEIAEFQTEQTVDVCPSMFESSASSSDDSGVVEARQQYMDMIAEKLRKGERICFD